MLPINNNTVDLMANNIIQVSRSLRAETQRYIDQCTAGTVQMMDLVSGYLRSLAQGRAQIQAWSSVQGVGAEFERRYPSKGFSADAEIQAVLSGAAQLIEYLESVVPTDKQGRLLTLTMRKDGSGLFDQVGEKGSAYRDDLKTNLEVFRDLFDAA